MLVSEVSAPGCWPRVLPMYFLFRARAFWNQTWNIQMSSCVQGNSGKKWHNFICLLNNLDGALNIPERHACSGLIYLQSSPSPGRQDYSQFENLLAECEFVHQWRLCDSVLIFCFYFCLSLWYSRKRRRLLRSRSPLHAAPSSDSYKAPGQDFG